MDAKMNLSEKPKRVLITLAVSETLAVSDEAS